MKQKYTKINTNESIHSEMGPVSQNRKNCSSKCAYDCTASVHNTTQNSFDNSPLTSRQTTPTFKISHNYTGL